MDGCSSQPISFFSLIFLHPHTFRVELDAHYFPGYVARLSPAKQSNELKHHFLNNGSLDFIWVNRLYNDGKAC